MKTIEKATLLFGCLGILFNVLGLLLHSNTLNFISVFLGRLSSLLFTIAIDTNRPHYYFPLVLSLVNIFVNSQELLFFELLSQAIIYQVSAYKLFVSKKV